MKIVTYAATSDDAPEGATVIGRIICAMTGAKGKRIEDFHPVIFQGTDPAAVRLAAQRWWDAEVSKEAAKEVSRAEQLARMRALSDAKKAARLAAQPAIAGDAE